MGVEGGGGGGGIFQDFLKESIKLNFNFQRSGDPIQRPSTGGGW